MKRNGTWPVCFVGQGPNQTAWKRALASAGKFGHTGKTAETWAERWCARVAITGKLGESLARLAGVERLLLYSRCERRNLNARFNGKVGKGDVFNLAEGKETAARIFHETAATRIVLLGRQVAACFGFRDAEFCKVYDRGGKRFLILPHPSGINTWWNEPGNKKLAEAALRRFVRSYMPGVRKPAEVRIVERDLHQERMVVLGR